MKRQLYPVRARYGRYLGMHVNVYDRNTLEKLSICGDRILRDFQKIIRNCIGLRMPKSEIADHIFDVDCLAIIHNGHRPLAFSAGKIFRRVDVLGRKEDVIVITAAMTRPRYRRWGFVLRLLASILQSLCVGRPRLFSIPLTPVLGMARTQSHAVIHLGTKFFGTAAIGEHPRARLQVTIDRVAPMLEWHIDSMNIQRGAYQAPRTDRRARHLDKLDAYIMCGEFNIKTYFLLGFALHVIYPLRRLRSMAARNIRRITTQYSKSRSL